MSVTTIGCGVPILPKAFSGSWPAGGDHEARVRTPAERRVNDTLQGVHWTVSLLKRWLLGTHAGAVSRKHLQAYLDEFAFRHNRRKTKGVGRITARTIEQLVACAPMTMRQLIDKTRPCRAFRS